jgi:glutaredoxin
MNRPSYLASRRYIHVLEGVRPIVGATITRRCCRQKRSACHGKVGQSPAETKKGQSAVNDHSRQEKKTSSLCDQSDRSMRPTLRLLRPALQLTLFTRANCGLCVTAKDVLSKVWDERHFEYIEIDVMEAKQTKWRNLYEFDTPVVRLLTPVKCLAQH